MAVALELQVAASSGGAQANNCTFAAVPGFTFYLTGFAITGLGATAGSTISITLTGTKGPNTPTWFYTVVAGATTANGFPQLLVTFGEKGYPSSGQNTAVTVNVPSFGAGNTNAAAVAWGFYA